MDTRNSLIVLPEAFNNGRSYYDYPRGQPSFVCHEMVYELTRIAAQFGTAFVTGLLDPPKAAACFIDQDGATLMRHKMGDDQTGHYAPCTAGCDFGNPIEKGGVYLGTLVCNDIQGHARGIAERLDQRGDIPRIVCIPCCMGAQWFGSGPLTTIYWKGKYVIVANSNADGCGSFIANTTGAREIIRSPKNKVVLQSWGELDSLR